MGTIQVELSSVAVVGLDLAKHVFQIHAVDRDGCVVVAKPLRRKEVLAFFRSIPPGCLIGLEACGSAHYWARELTELGHDARLMPPAYVKAYVRRQKNDAADAAAICEAVTRPSMRFVPIRSVENQAVLMHHKARELLVGQRTQLLNALRGHLAEIGIIAAQGTKGAQNLVALVVDGDASISDGVRSALLPLTRRSTDWTRKSPNLMTRSMPSRSQIRTTRCLIDHAGYRTYYGLAIAASVPNVAAFSASP